MVKVEAFLECLCVDTVSLDCKSEIEEVNGSAGSLKLPGEDANIIGVSLELEEFQDLVIFNPDAKHVIDVAFEEEEVGGVVWEESFDFMGSKIKGGPHADSSGSHGSAKEL